MLLKVRERCSLYFLKLLKANIRERINSND